MRHLTTLNLRFVYEYGFTVFRIKYYFIKDKDVMGDFLPSGLLGAAKEAFSIPRPVDTTERLTLQKALQGMTELTSRPQTYLTMDVKKLEDVYAGLAIVLKTKEVRDNLEPEALKSLDKFFNNRVDVLNIIRQYQSGSVDSVYTPMNPALDQQNRDTEFLERLERLKNVR